jgi:hypothetical protein
VATRTANARRLTAAIPGRRAPTSVFGSPSGSAAELRTYAELVGAEEVMFVCVRSSCVACYDALAQGWTAASI